VFVLLWLFVVAGMLFLYFGFWFVFTKFISYLSRSIESKIALYAISSLLWVIAVYMLTEMNFLATFLVAVVQAGFVVPYIFLEFRKKAAN
jgi:hypothetical protein